MRKERLTLQPARFANTCLARTAHLSNQARIEPGAHPFVARFVAAALAALSVAAGSEIDYLNLKLPAVGDHTLHVLTPTLLELKRLNSKPAIAAPVDSWNFVDANGVFQAPALSEFAVTVDGAPASVTAVGFKRRPFYAPVLVRDLRIENSL